MNWGVKKQQIREKLKELFPVRQVYFRTNGVVQFISIPSWVQMLAVGALTLASIWVLVTSFHFLARDIILEQKEETIRNMEVQVDHISDDMTHLKSNILERTRQLEARQRFLEALLQQDPVDPLLTPAANDMEMGPFLSPEDGKATAISADNKSKAQDAAKKAAQTYDRQSMLDPSDLTLNEVEDVARTRFQSIEDSQVTVAQIIEKRVEQNVHLVDAILKDTGLSSKDLLAEWKDNNKQNTQFADHAAGGPFIPTANLSKIEDGVLSNDDFSKTLGDLRGKWASMQNIFEALNSVPSLEPSKKYYISSRFGRRTDPIRKVAAVHYGLDMAGVAGSAIRSTAGGIAVKAKNWGPYGNMVEIDHGNGFKTRYGHLQKINVKEGQMVEKGQIIGKMGCTGRCTSTHVHYEVWFGDRPRDPYPFLKVNESVLVSERRSNE